MHSFIRLTLIASATLAVSLASSVQPLAAQSADSTTFRAGQWGAEFELGSYGSLGVLRFSSPTRAWIGAVSGRFQNFDDDSNPPQPGGQDFRAVNVRLGHRFYRPATANVMQHLTLGALAGVTRSEIDNPIGGLQESDSRVGGLFADLGALWMVTRSLSLGAAWTLSATVARTEDSRSSFEQDRTVTSVSLGQVSIRGALYF